MSLDSVLPGASSGPGATSGLARLSRLRALRLPARPELLGLLGLSAVLDLWGLGTNGWANTYYSAAARSMSTSWHDFLFASMDRSGLMTVDKPPLSLWVQALSARVFGLHPLSLLVPEALMGMLAVGLLYDLTRRRFGRVAGAMAGLVLATTPVVVAVSRHNNPDELLLLCSVAALWCGLRALDTGRTRWLLAAGVAVGLGFETKMGVALFVVPGLAVAWIWTRVLGQRGRGARLRAFGQLLWGGLAMVVVGGAWPLLVTLTPAADRPWISGTSDNSVWSLIFGYNGLGRVAGQTGGPAGGGGLGPPGGGAGPGSSLFGGATGPGRLLQSGLGDQAGWLLGFALVGAVGLLVSTRLRRRDPRTGWLMVIGGAFLCTAVVFSFAGGIFHPYYVSLVAPFAAALVGAGVGEVLPVLRDRSTRALARWLAPAALVAAAATELVVLRGIGGRLGWATPLVIAVAVGGSVLVLAVRVPRLRLLALAVALAGLLAAPTAWAAQTLGHASSGTFPAGGPAGASEGGGPGGAGRPGAGFGSGRPGAGGTIPGPGAAFAPPAGFAPRAGFGGPGGGLARAPGAPGGFGGPGAPSGAGGPFGGEDSSLNAAIAYARAHGGGTIGVASQSTAASAIVSQNADVAGLGGFSGRESSISVAWLADEVAAGKLRWIVSDASSAPRLPGDTRSGSNAALAAAARACPSVSNRLLDCSGRAAAIMQLGRG